MFGFSDLQLATPEFKLWVLDLLHQLLNLTLWIDPGFSTSCSKCKIPRLNFSSWYLIYSCSELNLDLKLRVCNSWPRIANLEFWICDSRPLNSASGLRLQDLVFLVPNLQLQVQILNPRFGFIALGYQFKTPIPNFRFSTSGSQFTMPSPDSETGFPFCNSKPGIDSKFWICNYETSVSTLSFELEFPSVEFITSRSQFITHNSDFKLQVSNLKILISDRQFRAYISTSISIGFTTS